MLENIPKITSEDIGETLGTFVVEPLDRGFGYTFGNSLRRVLLSSLEGAAVTSIQDPALYAAFLRGVTQAVRRIKADKRRYVTYFKEGWAAGDPAVQALTADDFNLGRIQLKEPGPIPEHEARWAWDWMASWGLIEGTFDVTTQINRKVEREAHELAALSA